MKKKNRTTIDPYKILKEIDNKCFDGKLLDNFWIKIIWSDKPDWKKKHAYIMEDRLAGHIEHNNESFLIVLNEGIRNNKKQIEDTLLHELIHGHHRLYHNKEFWSLLRKYRKMLRNKAYHEKIQDEDREWGR